MGFYLIEFLPLDFLHLLSLQQPVNFFLCNRIFKSDDTTPASGIEPGGHDLPVDFKGGHEGLPLLVVLGLKEYHVAMGDGVVCLVGEGGCFEAFEFREEIVLDLEGTPLGTIEVCVVQDHEAIFKFNAGFNQLLVVRIFDPTEFSLGFSEFFLL